jgi:hypothetical protein
MSLSCIARLIQLRPLQYLCRRNCWSSLLSVPVLTKLLEPLKLTNCITGPNSPKFGSIKVWATFTTLQKYFHSPLLGNLDLKKRIHFRRNSTNSGWLLSHLQEGTRFATASSEDQAQTTPWRMAEPFSLDCVLFLLFFLFLYFLNSSCFTLIYL